MSTTFAQLKTAVARDLRDPDNKTFTTTELGDMINFGIAECSRLAPQRFIEDVEVATGQAVYAIRGGTANLVANGSFETGEDGDESVLSGFTEADTSNDETVLNGWKVGQTLDAYFQKSADHKNGARVGIFKPDSTEVNANIYQIIPVNPGSVYIFSGWHWKGATGGLANRLRVSMLDGSQVVVTTGVIAHDTTSASPVEVSGTVSIPDDSSVLYLKVEGLLVGTQPSTRQTMIFDAIKLVEQSDAILVSNTARAQIELRRVEVWDESTDPECWVSTLQPASGEYLNSSQVGWDFWDGNLYVPMGVANALDDSKHILRVWGYAPYDRLTSDSQVTDLSDELEYAVRIYCRLEALERLVADRDQFTQWQTRSNNTDISPAGLMNQLSLAREEWRRRSRQLSLLRER